MFEFLLNVLYLALLIIILGIVYIVTNNAWSKEILSKQKNTLIWNNSLIILGIILIIATFIIFSWVAGITTIILSFVLYFFVGRKIMGRIENSILNKEK